MLILVTIDRPQTRVVHIEDVRVRSLREDIKYYTRKLEEPYKAIPDPTSMGENTLSMLLG